MSKRRTLLRRTCSTLVLWALVTVALLLSEGWLFFLILGGISLLGLWEYLLMLGPQVPSPLRVFSFLSGLLYLGAMYAWLHLTGDPVVGQLDTGMLVLLMIGAFIFQLSGRFREERSIWDVMHSVFAVLYTCFLFNFATRLLYLPKVEEVGATSGQLYILFLLVATKFTDMGAFLTGMAFGRTKMSPSISPKKTWEGFAGSIVFGVLGGALIYWIFQDRLWGMTWLHVFVMGLLISLMAVVGDLAESMMKRTLQVKDSGGVLPGIGGVLDLIDSICFTAPLMYFYLQLFVFRYV
ncbi:MAG: phosphatidate cytidylyltransferase [Verrucomicrobiota bacterium]